MPSNYTYPGVYIEEIPSGVHTIAGVSTSDTAFIDFFPRGPMNQAYRCTSLADFNRIFGGLDPRSPASYAIQQFYLNGGQVAWVIRVSPKANGGGLSAVKASGTVAASGSGPAALSIEAINEGLWGNGVQVAVTSAPSASGGPQRFNITAREVQTVNGVPVQQNGKFSVLRTETYRNLAMDQTDSRYVTSAVAAESTLIAIAGTGAGQTPQMVAPDASGQPPENAFVSLIKGSDGNPPDANALVGEPDLFTGIYALDRIAPFIFNILCIPAMASLDDASSLPNSPSLKLVVDKAVAYCGPKRAFLIVDVPEGVPLQGNNAILTWVNTNVTPDPNSAVYYPRLRIADPLRTGQTLEVPASGTLAGVYARTDAARGVWKTPAGIESRLVGATPVLKMTDAENGGLNPFAVNALRFFPIYGNVSWGGRTTVGADQQASEWKYIAVRRTALYIEESLYQGLKWVVFEPNDEPLWSQIRLNVGSFMQNLFRQGAFQGRTPREAYFVKCDSETTTQYDIDRGVVNIIVGFAPLKPAEFVVIKLQQMTAQAES